MIVIGCSVVKDMYPQYAVYTVYITETTNYLILTHYRLHATPFLLTPLLRTFFFPHLFTGIP